MKLLGLPQNIKNIQVFHFFSLQMIIIILIFCDNNQTEMDLICLR